MRGIAAGGARDTRRAETIVEDPAVPGWRKGGACRTLACQSAGWIVLGNRSGCGVRIVTRTSRPFASSISMRSSRLPSSASGRAAGMAEFVAGEASGTTGFEHAGGRARVTGTKAGAAGRVCASLASRRQRNRRLGLIPCRRATAEIFTPGRSASATIDCFSVSLHFRRVSATTEYRREKLSPDKGTDIAPDGGNRLQQELYPNRTARRPPA